MIATGSELATTPAENLFLPHPSDVWQTSDLLNTWIEMRNLSGASWDMIALLYSNGVFGDTWRIRTAATQADLTAAPVFDSGTVALYSSATVAASITRPSLFWKSPAHTEPWLRIDIASTSPDGYFRAGNLIVDTEYLPGRNFQLPLDIGPPASIDLRFLSIADAMTLQDLATEQDGNPVLILYDPENVDYLHNLLVWGLEQAGNNPRLTTRSLWAKRYVVEPYI